MFSGTLSPIHWIVVFIVAIIIFGPSRLPELGKSLGEAIRGFKKAINENDKNDEIDFHDKEK